METGVDPCLPNGPLGESPTISHCHWNVGTSDCESKTFLLSKSRNAGKLLFETQMTAIKLGWDSHPRGIYLFRFFRGLSRVLVRFRSMLVRIS